MKVTYINHSSFLVETEKQVFLFDYYNPDEAEYEKEKLPGLSQVPWEKQVTVFVSHKHHDHFDHRIFDLVYLCPHIQFVLPKDMKMNEAYMSRIGIPEEAWDKIKYMGKNELREFTDIRVETLRSTDEGVAFIVAFEGKEIYHAGDLNWWTWIGETEAEYEDMTRCFQEEIKKIQGRCFDAAFLPLDPRQEERFYWGFDYFMKHTQTKMAYPMHFWKDTSVIGRLKELNCSEEYRQRIVPEEFYKKQ